MSYLNCGFNSPLSYITLTFIFHSYGLIENNNEGIIFDVCRVNSSATVGFFFIRGRKSNKLYKGLDPSRSMNFYINYITLMGSE